MSNRARRRLLREWQLRAVIAHYARMGWDHHEDFTTLADWNRWHRQEFRMIWRDPLRFPDNNRPDSGLITIQIRNDPDRPLCLLDAAFPYECDESPIWFELAEDFELCGLVFDAALQRLRPLRRVYRRRFDWRAWDNEWPAGKRDPAAYLLEPCWGDEECIAQLRWAARFIIGKSFCLHQHSDRSGPLHAAKTCIYGYCPSWMRRRADWRPLSDTETLYLMAAYYAFEAAENLVRYAWIIRDETEQARISPEDDDALERLRGKMAAIERSERRYYAGFLADARELLALAEKETEREAVAATRAAWAKGGRHPKKSTGIQRLADALREERGPKESPRRLFDLAISRCTRDGRIEVEGFHITATADGKLISHALDGSPDRQPVDYEAWRKNYLGRKR